MSGKLHVQSLYDHSITHFFCFHSGLSLLHQKEWEGKNDSQSNPFRQKELQKVIFTVPIADLMVLFASVNKEIE